MAPAEGGPFLLSADSLTGPNPEVDRLAIGDLDPAPTTTGIGDDQRLVGVWVDNWSGDVAPAGVTLYTSGIEGWSATATLADDEVLAFLETTGDYSARRPEGPPVLQLTVTQFDWTGQAHFIALVSVFDLMLTDAPAAYQGEVECTLAATLECGLLSDDGVYRPGDTGEGVEALQADLIALDYLNGPASGTYGSSTQNAVRNFQRDYRLSRDGIAGPQTVALLHDVSAGDSNIVMASATGVGPVPIDRPYEQAMDDLEAILGTPESSTGWYAGPCDAQQWFKMTWGGFTAIFSDHGGGAARFTGWYVSDIDDLPSWLYFVGGIRPGSTWTYLQGIGAGFESTYFGLWYHEAFGYAYGMFNPHPVLGTQPPGGALVASLGVGTGGYAC
ncbi:MAG TPA: hypothetical protein DCY40_07705 [Actinobacteria bacterium]|nr:hypothetical protein [Actinomycetota bacterium]